MNYNLHADLVGFQMRALENFPAFKVGDEVKVFWFNRDGKKTRIENFTGLVIAIKGSLNTKSFILRKVLANVGVEKRFNYHSPLLQKVEVLRRGKVRRAKLYYIRHLRGRLARIKKQVLTQIKTEQKQPKVE